MYSRDFGEGIRSQGNMKEYMQQTAPPPSTEETAEAMAMPCPERNEGGGILNGLLDGFKKTLSNLQTDDIILIAIGLLLLSDSNTDNDILVLLIFALLFF